MKAVIEGERGLLWCLRKVNTVLHYATKDAQLF